MKFPSLKNLALSAGRTIKRFPFELLFALAATIAATIKIELADIDRVGENWCLRVMIVGNLGLLLSLSATLHAESRKLTAGNKFLLRVLAAIVAGCLIFLINPGIREADYVRFILLSLGLHLLVAFAAFTKGYRIQGFWQFNKTLFLRFLTSALYGIVLFLGLAAAIGAMNYLFNFKFEWDTFAILFTWMAGIFSTMFFLAGIPNDFIALNKDTGYPKGLKIFTQYVLIPLATVYAWILLAYEIKILVEWDLPKGQVSYLILSYAIFGILSLLLVYPIRNLAENSWIRIYSHSFYFLLIPLLGLLFVAVGERVMNYGVTELRYFLIILSCWLFVITLYFLFSHKQNIKAIPISLCILSLLAVYGPQSAFSVSMYSQRDILVDIMQRNNACIAGKLLPVKKINKEDGNRAIDVLDYLVTHHDLVSLQPYMDKNLKAVSDSLSKLKDNDSRDFIIENYELRQKKLSWIIKYLGLSKFSGSRYANFTADTAGQTTNYYFHKDGNVDDIKGYDYMINAKSYLDDTTVEKHDDILFTERKGSYNEYSLEVNKEKVSFNLAELAKNLITSKNKYEKVSSNNSSSENEYIIPDDSLSLTGETKHFDVILLVNSIRVNQTKTSIEITYADADYLVKEK